MIISTIAISVIIIYLLLIGLLIYGFEKVEDFKLQDLDAKTKFTVVIPFRNEAENVGRLLTSISKISYPKNLFEVILVDDDSEDDSVNIIKDFILKSPLNEVYTDHSRKAEGHIKVVKNNRVSNSPKKDAIVSAITVANYDWIITTDADCILPEFWLAAFDEFIQIKNPNCIVAPVTYHGANSFFNRFQILDILSLQGAAIGGFGMGKPFLCNGANFGYRKTIFKSVNGFNGNADIASGDDVFLLDKIVKHSVSKVHYLKSRKAIVKTLPAKNGEDLIQQRLRWASKTSKSTNGFSKGVGVIVSLANLVCIVLLPTIFLGYLAAKVGAALFIIKFSIDFLLLFKTARFFKQETLLLSYIFSSIIYPFFSVYIIILSCFKSYHWKGRTFKK